MLLFDVTDKFNTCIKELVKDDPDMERFIADHERKPVVLENLCAEVVNYEQSFQKGKQTRRHINEMVSSTAGLFFEVCKLHREQHNLSIIEKHKLTQKRDRMKELESICHSEVTVYGSGQTKEETE